MKPLAIASMLWPPNQRVLPAFVKRHPGTTVLSLDGLISQAMRAAIADAGGQVLALEALLDEPARLDLGHAVEARMRTLEAALTQPAWGEYWRAFPLSEHSLAALLSQVAAAQLPTLLRLMAAMDEAQKRFDLRLIVLNEDMTPPPRALVAWGRARGVPSVQLSHGVELFQPYTVHADLQADITAVFGERGVEGYADIGLDLSSLRITGNPAWDDYAELRHRRREIREAVAAEHGLSPHLPIVVFGTTWSANLTAHSDEGIHGRTLHMFLSAAQALVRSGLSAQFVVKDRPGAPAAAQQKIPALFADYGLPSASARYVAGEAMPWVVGSDVVISMQSNLSLEAMMVGTPAVDLLNEVGMWLGPCFAADSGVMEAEASSLADTLQAILGDAKLRARQRQRLAQAAPRHNIGVDGQATERFIALLETLLPTGLPPALPLLA